MGKISKRERNLPFFHIEKIAIGTCFSVKSMLYLKSIMPNGVRVGRGVIDERFVKGQ